MSESQQQMMVFVSHAHEDDAFCRVVVGGLRGAGADVWYDEHNLGSGQLGPTIERELRACPVFIVIVSPAALRSRWVEDEARWAYQLHRKDPLRTILPVTAATLPTEESIWLFLLDFRRIEAPDLQPFSAQEATRRLLLTLALTSVSEAPATYTAPQPSESAKDLVARGKALQEQKKYAEALSLFERAIQIAPRSLTAWVNLGETLESLRRWSKALTAYERAISLKPNDENTWIAKGWVLDKLKRHEEALAAFEQAITLDPSEATAWTGKASALRDLHRIAEAKAAERRAKELGG